LEDLAHSDRFTSKPVPVRATSGITLKKPAKLQKPPKFKAPKVKTQLVDYFAVYRQACLGRYLAVPPNFPKIRGNFPNVPRI
jgi:hypothetical protein